MRVNFSFLVFFFSCAGKESSVYSIETKWLFHFSSKYRQCQQIWEIRLYFGAENRRRRRAIVTSDFHDQWKSRHFTAHENSAPEFLHNVDISQWRLRTRSHWRMTLLPFLIHSLSAGFRFDNFTATNQFRLPAQPKDVVKSETFNIYQAECWCWCWCLCWCWCSMWSILQRVLPGLNASAGLFKHRLCFQGPPLDK